MQYDGVMRDTLGVRHDWNASNNSGYKDYTI